MEWHHAYGSYDHMKFEVDFKYLYLNEKYDKIETLP